MVEITKEQLIFARGEGGTLIAQDVVLETIEGNPTVKIVPLTRGKLQEIYQKATSDDPSVKIKADNDVVVNGLVSPKLTDGEINDMKPQMALAITQAVLAVSLGITHEGDWREDRISYSKSGVDVSKKIESEADMTLFLHEKGYTYFTIPNLTYPEMNNLVESVNRRTKKQEKEQKRTERKNKMKGKRR